jgi:hypothetical protein
VDRLGFVVFQDLHGRCDLVAVRCEDDAMDGPECVPACRLVGVFALRSGSGSVLGLDGAAGGQGFDEGPLAQIGLADLHGIEESGGGGPVGAAAGERVGDAVEVGLDGDAVLGVFKLDGRVDLRRGSLGYGDGSVVKGLSLWLDLAAES